MVTSVVQLLCRTTKLCWYDDDAFRKIVDDSKRFLDKVQASRAKPTSLTFIHGLRSCREEASRPPSVFKLSALHIRCKGQTGQGVITAVL